LNRASDHEIEKERVAALLAYGGDARQARAAHDELLLSWFVRKHEREVPLQIPPGVATQLAGSVAPRLAEMC
jgi:hypothetical protein